MQNARRELSRAIRIPLIAAFLGCFGICAAPCDAAEEPATAKAASKSGQGLGSAPAERWPDGRTIVGTTELERKMHAALEQPLTKEIEDATLDDIVKLLEERVKCTVVVERSALSAENIEPKQVRLSGRAQGGKLRTEMRRLLRSSDLALCMVNEHLLITTAKHAEIYTQVRVYQVHDLIVDPTDATAAKPKFDRLRDLIVFRCAPESWRENGGTQGEIKRFEGPGILAFAIVQTEEVHEDIGRLLALLREARVSELQARQQAPKFEEVRDEQMGLASPPPETVVSLPPPPPLPRGKAVSSISAAERRIYEALRRPTKFDFKDKPLVEIAAQLAERHGIAIDFDRAALTADGVDVDERFTFRWSDGELHNGLSTLLAERGLDYVVKDEILIITTRTASETELRTVVYQVHDLAARDMRLIGRPADLRDFPELIGSLIAPETWREGSTLEAAVFVFEAPGLQALVIEQTSNVHRQLESFLDLLREAHEPKVYEVQRRRPIVVVAPPPPKLPPQPTPQQPAARNSGGNFFNLQP